MRLLLPLSLLGPFGCAYAQWSPDLPHDVAGRCPSVQQQELRVRYGGGAFTDSGLLSALNEVMWVGPECLEVFAGSPSVHKLPGSGGWLYSHDFFGSSYRLRGLNNTAQVLHSVDGLDWSLRSNVSKMYWANLFSVPGKSPAHAPADVYLMGTHGDDFKIVSAPNTVPMKGGPVVIAKSSDEVIVPPPPLAHTHAHVIP